MEQEFGFTACLISYLHAETEILLDSFPLRTVDILNSTQLSVLAVYLNNSISICL